MDRKGKFYIINNRLTVLVMGIKNNYNYNDCLVIRSATAFYSFGNRILIPEDSFENAIELQLTDLDIKE